VKREEIHGTAVDVESSGSTEEPLNPLKFGMRWQPLFSVFKKVNSRTVRLEHYRYAHIGPIVTFLGFDRPKGGMEFGTAGPGRSGSSPAASLTVGKRYPQRVLDSLTGP